MGQKHSSFWKPMLAGSAVILAVISLSFVWTSEKPKDYTMKARKCATTVQAITAPVIAQLGKTRTTKGAETAALPALIAQAGRTRLATSAANSLVQNVRCLPKST